MRIGATSLFRAVAAGMLLLVALALSSASAFACDERQEGPTSAQTSLESFLPYQFSTTVAVAEVAAIADIGQSSTDDGAAGPGANHAGHCPCCNSHCSCGASCFVSPTSADFPALSASSPQWSALEAPRGGLPESPDERPPRLI